MSTEIYGSRFRSGEIVGIDLSAFVRAFAGMIVLQEEGALGLGLESSGEVKTWVSVKRSEEEVTSFAVLRPVDDPRLYGALLELLRQEGVVVYAPESPPVIGCTESEKHLPEDMSSALGPGVVVESGSALRSALFGGSLRGAA